MKLLHDKVFIRITKESRDGIFSKEITKDDGSRVRLFTNVEAGDIDDRRSTLFVQTGIVEAVADNVKGIEVGDIAILDYKLCNMDDHIVFKDENGIVYWLEARTIYHTEDLIAYANQNSPRDQVAYLRGDYDTLSMLLGVVRENKIYAREPFVFLEKESNVIVKVSASGILYSETMSTYDRKVLAIAPESQTKFGITAGDQIRVHDFDIFVVKIDGKEFECVCADDCLLKNEDFSLNVAD